MPKSSSSLRRQLIWLVVCVVGLAVTPIAGLSAWRNGERDVSLETVRLNAAALVVASMAAEPVAQNDPQGAFRALRSIGQMKDVEYGRIEDEAGRLLAETGAGVRLKDDVRTGHGGTGDTSLLTQLFSRTSEVVVPVLHTSREIGHVLLLGRTPGMLERFLMTLGESLAVAFIAIGLGFAIAWRLQERIARPILALSQTMQEIEETYDFRQSVSIDADGEIGQLVGGFNRMLSEIQVRDERIAAQMAGLEDEVKSRTAELVIAKDAAEAANVAKSDFLATMSHEIRTPMNGVMVMAEMLAAGELPPRERRFADVIAKSGASLLAIINDILDFSKMEAGKLELEAVPVDLSEIVDDVLSLFWDRAASNGLDLASFVHPNVAGKIAADPVRLRQVISNLVNNAIKFTEKGGVLVEVSCTRGGTIEIAVEDTGIGIPEDKIDDVFAAFTQADQSTTRRYGGTGLGLAICKKLVDVMGGEWRLTSTVGQGSRFAFAFAATELAPAADWPRPGSRGSIVALAMQGIMSRRALAAYLELAGYRVADASEADILIGDPASLRAFTHRTQTMICLASYGESEPQKLLRQGVAQAILAQPIRREEVARLLSLLASNAPLAAFFASSGSTAPDMRLPVFAGSRVLVADDSAVNREVAIEALRQLAIEVKVVNDGQAAVEAVFEDAFDAVLMDGSMPGLSGFDATREIRRQEAKRGLPRIPVIALTAHVVGAGADAWRDTGMDAVLHKPFTLNGLAQALGRFLPTAEPNGAPAEPPHAAAAIGPTSSQPGSNDDEPAELLDRDVIAQLESFAARGRADFVERVLNLYFENAPATVKMLQLAVDIGDATGAAQASHALKSMSYNIGAAAVARAAAEIESKVSKGSLISSHDVNRLSGLLDATITVLSPLISAEIKQKARAI